ncbi:MAG: hypothetical protein IKL10_01680 [Clostridia bacterium]|nr:hypothetical protein [Clostridia bacterium]
MNDTGIGKISPGDTEEFIEVSVKFTDDEVSEANFICSDDEVLTDCGETICRMIKYHTAEDIMQVTNNVVFYNTKNKIPREKLYLGAMAVMAAKRAVADWGRKNGKEFSNHSGCSCY